jgi:hypothetical protein
MTSKLYEFRDYHYVGDMDDYRRWWAEALPIFQDRFEVLGLWFDSGEPPRIMGSDPMPLPHGSANVTWILAWPDLSTRDEQWDALWDDDEWKACWDRHPGFDNYVNMSVRFLREAPSSG